MRDDFPSFIFEKGSRTAQKYLTAIQPHLSQDQYSDLVLYVFQRFFSPEASVDLSDLEAIRQVCLDSGVQADLANRALDDASSPATSETLKVNTDRALELGCFGLPYTHLHLAEPQSIFGSDRIHLIGYLLGEKNPPILRP